MENQCTSNVKHIPLLETEICQLIDRDCFNSGTPLFLKEGLSSLW